MSDPREREVKFDIDPADVGALRNTIVAALADPGTAKRLAAVYFDTPGRHLRDHGATLRIRSDGERRVQTLKAAARGGGGLFDRAEWEAEVDSDTPDTAALRLLPFRAVPKGEEDSLAAVFETVIERTIWLVATADGAVEIALDDGRIIAGEHSCRVTELELELKGGVLADLFDLLGIFGEVPLRIGVQTKSERGYALADGRPGAVKADKVALQRGMTAAAAFQAIAGNCLRQMRLNEPIVCAQRAPEALHQMRVGLRRLRSAIALFGDVVGDAVVAGLKDRLRRLSRDLGDARNLDVLLGHRVLPGTEGDEPGIALFRDALEMRRREAYERVIATFGSPAYRRLMLDLLIWAEAGPWLGTGEAGPGDEPVERFAAGVLERRCRKVRAGGGTLADLGPQERHRVRIAAKTLRYAADFFEGLANGAKERRRHAAFVDALADLQEQLGTLNDRATAGRLAADVAAAGVAPAALFAAGRLVGAPADPPTDRVQAAIAAHRRVAKAKRFWGDWAD